MKNPIRQTGTSYSLRKLRKRAAQIKLAKLERRTLHETYLRYKTALKERSKRGRYHWVKKGLGWTAKGLGALGAIYTSALGMRHLLLKNFYGV